MIVSCAVTTSSNLECSATCPWKARIPQEHPLRAIRKSVDEALRAMAMEFDGLYATTGRPSIPPERLLRALLLQIFYSIRSERMLGEQLEYNLLFRWFVGITLATIPKALDQTACNEAHERECV
jgi:transposase